MITKIMRLASLVLVLCAVALILFGGRDHSWVPAAGVMLCLGAMLFAISRVFRPRRLRHPSEREAVRRLRADPEYLASLGNFVSVLKFIGMGAIASGLVHTITEREIVQYYSAIDQASRSGYEITIRGQLFYVSPPEYWSYYGSLCVFLLCSGFIIIAIYRKVHRP